MQLLLMCTMCNEAPEIAAAPMTSLTASMLEPGSISPKLRTCVNTGTRRDAASRNI